ncbi:uncharacterized protein MJAP1_003870 [Malassezia japonica]|uniref:Peroxin/Ferlin domain-containing protein n=1 Tax=Malassezia japonica TaxID=223818 RepID=A0AAF0F6L9_9BASI|nr:uncharacterized protein MJAP1_003870 [Malassezia japonica]WFD40879.1 hypothetical protein MJAP1_003870 [Malassezia japonica]
MSGKGAGAIDERSPKRAVETMTLMDIIERVPPSMMQLLVALAPTIDLVHRFLTLATWRGGYRTRVQSWLLLLGYMLVCLYGYEVLRYAPQVIPLAWIAYTSLRASFARVVGQRQTTPGGTTSKTIKRAVAQLCDISDFVAAVCEMLVYPLATLLAAQTQGPGVSHLVIFLLASWPLWLLVMLPPHMWITPYYIARTTLGHVLESAPALAVRAYVHESFVPASLRFAEGHAPKLYETGVYYVALAETHVLPALRAVIKFLNVRGLPLALQVIPPFPVAALSLRYVFLVLGVIALTWCSPWATLLRRTMWRSALVRHTVLGVAHVLSGTDNVVGAWRTAMPKRLHGTSSALVKAKRNLETHETVFQFEIYENQRWWIGLDWTAALLPQERPSWSDSDNNAVAPPSSFTLPSATCAMVPSLTRANRDDCRIAEWHWVDLEWRVAGAQSITSAVYTPASSMSAKEAQRLSSRFASDKNVDDSGAVLDAADRLKAATDAAAKSGSPTKTEAEAMADAAAELPEELRTVARPSATASNASDVDPEGWQYGDNAWEKMSRASGMGRYTRRRCWVRRAVLVQTVEHDVIREVS